MNSRNELAEMPIRPLLYTMAVPLMLSLLVQSLYNIVDSIFVARLSETALTAASLVYSIQFLMIAVGVGTVIFWCFPGQLLQLFSASSEMLLLGIPALRIISISFVMAAITILCGYFPPGLEMASLTWLVPPSVSLFYWFHASFNLSSVQKNESLLYLLPEI